MLDRVSNSARLAAGMAGGVGVFGLLEASGYDFGSTRNIGPAVFPAGLSLILILAAVGIVAEQVFRTGAPDGPLQTARIDVLLCVLGGPLAFAFLIERFGLMPAIFACISIAALADRSLRPVVVLALAALMSLLCSLLFVGLLSLPIEVLTW